MIFKAGHQLLYIERPLLGTAAPLEFVPIALVENFTFSEGLSFLSGVTRLSDGWDVSIPLSQSFTATVSALQTLEVLENNEIVRTSIKYIRTNKRKRLLCRFRIASLDVGHSRTFYGYIQDISEQSPSGGFVRFSFVIRGEGEPIDQCLGPLLLPTWDTIDHTFDSIDLTFDTV